MINPELPHHDTRKSAIDNLRVDASIAYYERNMYMNGPQLEGFTTEWLRDALRDPQTRKFEIEAGIDWPLFVLVRHNQDYRSNFFSDHFPDRPAYYFSYPPHVDEKKKANSITAEALASMCEEDSLIVYDYHISGQHNDPYISFLKEAMNQSDMNYRDVTPESEAFGMSYGYPKVTHFEGIARRNEELPLGDCNTTAAFARLVVKGERLPLPEHGATVLTPALLEENNKKALNEIWEIYSNQFDELVDDHPSLQIQPREELERMLLDEDSFNVAYMEHGKIVSLVYFVSNINKCPWLNPDFFATLKDERPGLKLSYFPGIVVDKDKAQSGAGYVDEMIKLIENVFDEAGMLGMQIVFQCTNVSETYIPKIVTSIISANGIFGFEQSMDESGSAFRKTAEYKYRVLAIDPK